MNLTSKHIWVINIGLMICALVSFLRFTRSPVRQELPPLPSIEVAREAVREVVREKGPPIIVREEIPAAVITEGEEEKPKSNPPQDLRLRLRGVAFLDEENSYAFIEDLEKLTRGVYRVGDRINGWEVIKILTESVALKRDGHFQIVRMEFKEAQGGEGEGLVAQEVPEEEVILDRKGLLFKTKEVFSEVKKILVKPHRSEAGEIEGLMVAGIQEGGIVEGLKLRNGDIIKSVNGYQIDSATTAVRVAKRLQKDNVKTVVVVLVRNGQTQTRTYKIRN